MAWAQRRSSSGCSRCCDAAPTGGWVNISSDAGALTDMGGGLPAYNTALLHQRPEVERHLTVAFRCLRKVGGSSSWGSARRDTPAVIRPDGGHVEVG